MKQISIRELQTDTEAWISQAAIEKQIVVTDNGQPVAAIIPLPSQKPGKTLPNREERIQQQPYIPIDSAVYISEMRD